MTTPVSIDTIRNTVNNGIDRATSFVEKKEEIREDQTVRIKNQESMDARAEHLEDNERHIQNRNEVKPLLEQRGITLNSKDQLEYLPGFEAPQLETEDLWLVRHSETHGNKKVMRQGVCDGPINQLNKFGKEQARKLRNLHNPVDVLIVSPLGRTQDTAKEIVFGELDKGNRIKVSMDDYSRETMGYYNKIALALRQSDDIEYNEDTREFYRKDKADNLLGLVEVNIDFNFREMSFGAVENDSVHGVHETDPSHLMEYDQNAVWKVAEDFEEDYMILDEDGKPELYDDGKPKMGHRTIPAESFSDMTLRCFNNIDTINTKYKGKRVGIVGHGIVTRGLLTTRKLIKPDPIDQHLNIDGAKAAKVPNAKMIDLMPKSLSDKVTSTLNHLDFINTLSRLDLNNYGYLRRIFRA